MYNQLTPEIIEEIKKVSNNVFLGEEINPDYAKQYSHVLQRKLQQ